MSTPRAEDIARRLLDSLPAGLAGLDQDVRRNARAALINALQRMDLVSREEFDVQTRLLASSSERLEELEKRLKALEAQLDACPPT